MKSRDGRWVIVYNGEIYNCHAIKDRLTALGCSFRGTSDTEILLEAIAVWGVDATLPLLNGMFAFAVYDTYEESLWLARDRFGEKPLYYFVSGDEFVFASELKSLMAHPRVPKVIDRESLELFLTFSYVPAPWCIWQGVKKLCPGSYLVYHVRERRHAVSRYWDHSTAVVKGKTTGGDARQVVAELDRSLRCAIKSRMLSDVPLGAFLSGGIDSSLVVALMQAQSGKAIKTFTIGFWEAPYNEAQDAAQVARHLGTEHHELYLTSGECTDMVPTLAEMYDEPFGDSSQIPTALVSSFTAKHVKVALSGDGGDELWGGYNRYAWSNRLWPRVSALPLRLRAAVGRGLLSVRPETWDALASIANAVLPRHLRARNAGVKLHKFAAAIRMTNSDELYRSFVSQRCVPLREQTAIPDRFLDHIMAEVPHDLNFVERMMFCDLLTYLPDDILCKVDRASMASGLEARVPFLDNDHVEYSWSVPIDVKLHRGISKWPLRQTLARYVPPRLTDRPKQGFSIPLAEWLRGPLRSWAGDLLGGDALRRTDYIDCKYVGNIWEQHQSGQYDHSQTIWNIATFQSWLHAVNAA